MRDHHPRIMRALTTRLAVGGCALALSATACSYGDASTSPTGAATASASDSTGFVAATAATAATSAATEASAGTAAPTTAPADAATSTSTSGGEAPEPYLSPLDEALGYGAASQTSAEEEAAFAEQSRQVEELIAACMQEQGFTYVPVVGAYTSGSAGDPYSLPPKEFAEQYGYGMTTIDDSAAESADPNVAIRSSMTVTELRAYYQALYGDYITVDDDGQIVKRGPSEAAAAAPPDDACANQASTTVFGSKDEAVDEGGDNPFAALQESMSALSTSIETDARVQDATSEWIGCMADAGHPGYTEKTDAPVDVGTRAGELRGDAGDYSDVDPAALQELREYEISVAVADYECGLAWDAVHQTVQTELETTFVAENRPELEQYRDALADGTAGRG